MKVMLMNKFIVGMATVLCSFLHAGTAFPASTCSSYTKNFCDIDASSKYKIFCEHDNGGTYEGMANCDGNYDGFGIYTFKDGSNYVGEFRNSKYHGYGIHKDENGWVYSGQFYLDKRQGNGSLENSDGTITFYGVWHDDKIKAATIRHKNGTVMVGKYNDNGDQDGEWTHRESNGEEWLYTYNNGTLISTKQTKHLAQAIGEKRDQFFRDIVEWYEREKREAQEQTRTKRTESTQTLEKQEKMQMASELLPIISGLESAKNAIEAGKCDQAQRLLDEIRPKIKTTRPSYSMNGMELEREDMETAVIAYQAQVYLTCLSGQERIVKLLGYLEQEAKNGNKVAQKGFSEARDMMRAEIEKNSGQRGKNKNVPKFSDYGTDVASLLKYESDLSETDVGSCQELWKKKDADAAYCLARQETGEKEIAMLRDASKLGHPIAQNNLAMRLDDSKPLANSSEISMLIRASANSGIPHAEVTVGWWHMTGEHGFKTDHAEAMKWNLKAYKQGHSEGANNIGELYEKGLGVPKDMEQAKSWYKKASVLGNAKATERLEKLDR